MNKLTVLSGGMGGARFLQGLRHALAGPGLPGVSPDAEITVIANTADDLWIHGLKVCPDLDTVMYTLGDGIDLERGWGRREETWGVKEELAAYGVEPTWFGLGDRDIGTHLVRTQMLDAGYRLSEVTEALCQRWQPGVRLLPMTDDRVETHVAIADPDSPSGRRVVHFQEYWVRLRAELPAEAVVFVGLDDSEPAPGVIDAITDADLVILPPSNPVVSVGTILGVPRVREALVATRGTRRGPVPHRRRHPRARDGRADAHLHRRRGQCRGRRPALRRPLGRRRARRLAGRRTRCRRGGPGARGRHRLRGGAADDDRPRRDRRDGCGRGAAWLSCTCPRCRRTRPTACPR